MSVAQAPMEARSVAQQLVKYRNDFRLFAREQLKITGQPVNFWPCQLPLLEDIERQLEKQGFARAVWLKSRQVGASTLAEAIVAWRTMLWPHINAMVIGDEAERSRSLFDIAKGFYEQMDPEIRPVGRYITKSELVFANPSHITRHSDPGMRSRIKVESAHKKNIAIGSNWQIVHLSEVSRYPNPEFVLDGVIPGVHRVPGTIVIMESTAEMAGTWFRDFCEESYHKRNAFEFSFVPWFLQPEYYICPVCSRSYPMLCNDRNHKAQAARAMDFNADERHIMAEFGLEPGHIRWMREKLGEMGQDWDLFRQNFPLTREDAWVTPGAQAFPLKKLREQKANVLPPKRYAEVHSGPQIFDAPQGRLSIWKEPEVGIAYDCGVDVAMGLADDEDAKHGDASVACMIIRGSGEQVAEWSSRTTDPLELATVLYWLCTYYNTAQLAVETNGGMGGATNAQLSKMGYSNSYIWRYRDEVVPRYTRKTGWETSIKSKPWLVGFAVHELLNDRVIIRSELLLREMENFVRKGPQEWEAVAGYHDDKVLAWMIAVLVSDDENFGRYYGLQAQMNRNKIVQQEIKARPESWEADLTFNKKLAHERIDLVWD